MQIICVYELQSRRLHSVKMFVFKMKWQEKLDMESSSEIIVSLGDLNGHVGKCVEGPKGVHEGNGIGKRNGERILLEIRDERELCMANTWLVKQTKGKSLIVC